jgi:hypothetical protein
MTVCQVLIVTHYYPVMKHGGWKELKVMLSWGGRTLISDTERCGLYARSSASSVSSRVRTVMRVGVVLLERVGILYIDGGTEVLEGQSRSAVMVISGSLNSEALWIRVWGKRPGCGVAVVRARAAGADVRSGVSLARDQFSHFSSSTSSIHKML